MIQLRDYQERIIADARDLMRTGYRSVLIQAPTGSGKTALMARMLATAASRGMQSWFVVHRRELIDQSMEAFDLEGVAYDTVAATHDHRTWRDAPIKVCSIQTLAHRHTRLKPPNLIVFDEAHHCAAKTWSTIAAEYPKAYRLGLTATPERLDGKGLREWFKIMIEGPKVRALIDEGYLADYRLFIPPGGIDVSGVHTQMGDFNIRELAAAADKPTITGCAVEHYQKLVPGRKALVFAVSIAHSMHVVEQFRAAGIYAEHIDGKMPNWQRQTAIAKFAAGEVEVLSNCELVGEGFDVPDLEVAILLRPTQSTTLYLQQVGRALRPAPGKEWAVILDHAGNASRHGFPDAERSWKLDGRTKAERKADAEAIKVSSCPHCFAAMKPGLERCPHCGTPIQRKGREVQQVDGELQEVARNPVPPGMPRQPTHPSECKSLEELIALGRRRNYKRPEGWAYHYWRGRQNARLRGVKL